MLWTGLSLLLNLHVSVLGIFGYLIFFKQTNAVCLIIYFPDNVFECKRFVYICQGLLDTNVGSFNLLKQANK